MNTFQLSCFIAVAETLNFAKAAETLHVTQPAVTHQIQSLESELNTKLFRRSTRSVEITASGIAFLHDARSILAITDRARRRCLDPEGMNIQQFSIGCHSFTHLFALPDILRELSHLYANLHPTLRVVPFQYLYRLLGEEDVDAIIGFQEQNEKRVPGVYQELIKVPIVCLCTPDNPLCALGSVRMKDLSAQPLILHNPIRTPGTLTGLQAALIEGRSASDLYFCDIPESAIVLAKAGLGISILPNLLIPPDSGLVHLPLVDGVIREASFGVYYKGTKGNPVLKSFLALMQEHFAASNSEAVLSVPPSAGAGL